MSKTLKTIQTLAKIGKIICKVIYICCLVGGIACAVGITLLLAIQGIDVDGQTLAQTIEAKGNTTIGTVYAGMAIGIIYCAAECVMTKFAEKYFEKELLAGTPFTLEGAKQMLILGFIQIGIAIAASITAAITFAIFKACTTVYDLDVSDESSLGMGLVFIVTSFIFKYGAEVKGEKEAPKEEDEQQIIQ